MKAKLNFAGNLILGFMTLLLVVSCNPMKSDWEKISQVNTFQAYEDFLAKYNDHIYREMAIQKIWELTTKENVKSSYDDFLIKYPESVPAKQAIDSVWAFTVRENTIQAYQDFIVNHADPDFRSRAEAKINRLYTAYVPTGLSCQLTSSLDVNISFDYIPGTDSYKLYWSYSKNGPVKESDSYTIQTNALDHWPDHFPIYYRVMATKGDLKTRLSDPCKVALLPDKDGTACQICGDEAIGYCHLREIYVCSAHNIFTDKEGNDWQCP
jgi:hypothetical protein